MSPKGKQLTLSDRIAIETGLMAQDPLKKIAATLGKHPTTISLEIKNNRTFVVGTYWYGNNCRYAKNCGKHNVCGDAECTGDCVRCRSSNCHEFCDKYISLECERHNWPPYVCNACSLRKNCKKNRYFYSATYADATVARRRSEMFFATPKCRKLQSKNVGCCNCKMQKVAELCQQRPEVVCTMQTSSVNALGVPAEYPRNLPTPTRRGGSPRCLADVIAPNEACTI